ncbi:MAG: DUF2309 family protein [Planctomycetaceae bacterium]|nr:DUF2309 family protein [Planctomycetaceae bacterium]
MRLPEPTLVQDQSGELTSPRLRRGRIADAVREAAEFLPVNGALTRFRHQNPLHGFEHLPFASAVREAALLHRSEIFLTEAEYAGMVENGRLTFTDLYESLQEDLAENGTVMIGDLVSRFDLRLALLRAVVAEQRLLHQVSTGRSLSDALDLPEQPTAQDIRSHRTRLHPAVSSELREQQRQFDCASSTASWLAELWSVCCEGTAVSQNRTAADSGKADTLRDRDLVLSLTGIDTDELVNAVLSPLLASFLDQGQVRWQPGDRRLGLLHFFADLHGDPCVCSRDWLRNLRDELRRFRELQWDGIAVIEDLLHRMQIPEADQQRYLQTTVHALPGWTGMVHYLENGGDWMPQSVPHGTLTELVALRLMLEHLAVTHVLRIPPAGQASASVPDFRPAEPDRHLRQLRIAGSRPRTSSSAPSQLPADTFTIAQILGWSPRQLSALRPNAWAALADEIQAFDSREVRRCFQSAWEGQQRRQFLDAVSIHRQRGSSTASPALTADSIQMICCADPCAESFRRHLEEIDSACETFGVPGFFGLDINVRSPDESRFNPQVPVNVRARRFIQQLPGYLPDGSLRGSPRQNRRAGFTSRGFSSVLEDWLNQRWLTRLLFPRIRQLCTTPPAQTPSGTAESQLDCTGTSQSPEQPGYTVEEMADAVRGTLDIIGLAQGIAPLVLLVGHASQSINNPWQSADQCSFCCGRSSGLNARVLATMANDHRVRRLLAEDGIRIPEDTVFVALEHETCGDTVEYYDVDYLTPVQQQRLDRAVNLVDEALRRNAHERCRRFTDVSLTISRDAAALCVEGRTADLTQMCPELSSSGNAWCFVGRRSSTRHLFLDRRAFLASYDPFSDDEDGSQLGRLLRMLVRTCVDVNLQYYFASLDPEHYSAGSRLPHTVTSGIGVTHGHGQDLCVGLPREMIQSHEPRRLTWIVETTTQIMSEVLSHDPALRQLCDNEWLFLVVQDPVSGHLFRRQGQEFVRHQPRRTHLPEVCSSERWYRGLRENLSPVSIAGRADESDLSVHT